MIKTRCGGCGRHLEAPDEAAGKKGKCPGCSAVFEISSAPLKGRLCPGCGAECGEHAVICVSCGLNLHTGAKVEADGLPADKKRAGFRLVLEGALCGALYGAAVLAALVLTGLLLNMISGRSGGAGERFLPFILHRALLGAVWGGIVGVVTVLTRSEKYGIAAGVILFAIPVFLAWRSVLGSAVGFVFMLAGFAFSGVMVYAAGLAVAKGVMAGIKWEKYR